MTFPHLFLAAVGIVAGRAVVIAAVETASEANIPAVDCSPDGRTVASVGDDSVVRLWGATIGQTIGDPLKHRFVALLVAFNSDGTRLATGSSGGMARIWTLRPAVTESPAVIMLWPK